MNNPLVLGLVGPLFLTLGFASGTVPAGLPPSAVCIADTSQTIALADSAYATVRVADSALECPT